MDKDIDKKELELFEQNIELRVELINKKISNYIQELGNAVEKGETIPLPDDE